MELKTRKVRIQSVDRTLDIIEELSSEKQGLKISELANRLELQISTTYNLVNTLRARDYIHQNPENKMYYLGYKILHLKNTFLGNLDIRKIAIPFINKLHKEIPETIHLSVLEGDYVIPVYRMESSYPIRVDSAYVGNRGPIYCTATGRAFLLNYEENEIAEKLSTLVIKPFTEHTITDLKKLKEEIIISKERGYTQDFMEYQNDVFCIGVPIYDHNNEVIASISISVPSTRFSPQENQKISKALFKTSVDIAKLLGYQL